ncbi:MAG TPA: hypothetical protein VFQ30_14415 [Ktedonobacteraceae bacterium]|nr:hypothetical protein [Ktedonobacteraceae bacterium]
MSKHPIIVVLSIAIIASVLASCGTTTGQANTVAPTPHVTQTLVPTATPTHVPTPTPKPTPKPQPTVVVQPAPTPTPQPVTAAPPILDLQPLSMSIVGHLDCNKGATYVCFARVLSRASNQRNLNWFASTNVPGHIFFSPSGGTLAPGQSILVTIDVPFNACTQGLFFFHGPINTHTITWAC